MDYEKYVQLVKDGYDLYARLIRENPKEDKYQANFLAYRNCLLEINEKENKNK